MDLRIEIMLHIKTLLISKMISNKINLLLKLKYKNDFIIEYKMFEKIDMDYKDLIIYLLNKNNYWS